MSLLDDKILLGQAINIVAESYRDKTRIGIGSIKDREKEFIDDVHYLFLTLIQIQKNCIGEK